MVIIFSIPLLSTPLLSAEEIYTNENATSDVIVKAEHNGIPYDISGHKSAVGTKNYINLLLPCGADVTDIKITFSDGTVESFDLTSTVDISLLSTSINQLRTYTLRAVVSDLPAFFINIDESKGRIRDMNRSPDHSVYCYGEYSFNTPDGDVITGTLSLRGRGNATWGLDKKPYQIRLDEKADLLGMGDSRTWNLLANHGDRSLIRGKIVYDMAHEIGVRYAVDTEYVDVFMNGEYLGNYLLCEKVQVNEHRVEITENGYLLEYDQRGQGEPYNFRAPLTGQNVVIKEPDIVPTEMFNDAKEYITAMENAIASADGYNNAGTHYTEYLDITSSIKLYWLNEIVKNGDYGMGSTFYYREPDSLLYSGPAWDYDIILANAMSNFGAPTEEKAQNLGSTTGWWLRMVNELSDINTSTSIQRHLFKHEDYRKASLDLYFSTIREAMYNMLDNIRIQEQKLQKSATMNFIKWNVLDQGHTWRTPNKATTYKGEVDFIYDFLEERIDWIDRTMKAEYLDYYGYEYTAAAAIENIESADVKTDTDPVDNENRTEAVSGIGYTVTIVIILMITAGLIIFGYLVFRKRHARMS